MKKIAIGFSVFFALVVGVLLIGPSLIDWNNYTDDIADQVEKVTGRKVVIGGPVSVQVLPRPRLHVADVHLANIGGSTDARMASFESLEVRVAAMALLGGKMRVETVKLVRPTVLLERLADGRVNWDFSKPVPAKDSRTPQPTAADKPTPDAGVGTAGSGIAVDNFTVEGGTIVYRDLQRGREEVITGIDARIAAASLNGPVESDGALTLAGHRLAYSLNVAEIVQGRTIPLVFSLKLGSDTVIKVDGGVVNVPEKPRLRAKVTGSGSNVAEAIAATGGFADLPVNLAKPFTILGNLDASVDGGRVEGLEIKLDNMEFHVSADVATGDKTVASLSVKSGWVDLDALLAPAPAPAPVKADEVAKPGDLKKTATAKPAAPAKQAKPAAGFVLPKDIQANLSVQIDSLVLRGKPLEGVSLSADLANGELTLNQATAQLPGDADVGLFGFLSARDGKLRFEGQIETRAKDLGPVLAWAVPGVAVPDAALKDFSFKTPLVIDGNYAQLTGIAATAGGTKVTGAVTFAMQARPSFGANLELDKINLDALMAPASSAKSGRDKAPADTAVGGSAPATTAATAPAVDLFAPLKPLTTFDANVKLAIGSAVVRGQTARNITLDATLARGDLTLRALKIGNFAGLSAGVTGGLAGLDGIPTAKDLKITANTKDAGPLAKALALDLPVSPEALGAVSVNATVSGSLLSPSVTANLGAMGGAVGLRGALPVLALAGQDLRLGLSVQHGDLAGLLRRFGVDYRPQGKVGGFDLTAQVTGNPKSIRVDNIAGKVGPVTAAGSLSLALEGAKPKAIVNLALGPVDVTPFLPAKRAASLLDRGWGITRAPAAWAGPGGGNPLLSAAAVSSRWSKAPIDLAALNALDAAVTVTSPKVTVEGAVLENADLGAAVDGGVLTVERLTGRLFGGMLTAKATATAAGQMSAAGQIAGADLSKAGQALGSVAAGKINADFDITARGRSEAQIISSLGGKLNFSGRDLDAEALSGSAEAGFGLGGVVLALNQLGGVLGGPKQGKGLADVDAAFTISGGVATSNQLKAVTNVGVASGSGSVDLAAWTVDISGAIQPAPNLLSAVLSITTRKGVNVPFTVTGKLDAPRIKVDTASLGTGGVPVPGLDKLLKKKGVGDVLQGILGGGQQQQPAQPQAEQPATQTEEKKKVTPQDLLRGILGKF
ncbi:AsmA family protein [Thalassospiraceae bacterium LMO-SO8]|nr:AsmA family protein [Alphaproteobacteria bacterium LMO-S08]WND74658.1 AsmA family protein [Thalassospiraceae bacterium LMO-SO8]